MKTKEMTMNDYRTMYAEYCLEAGEGGAPAVCRLGPGTPESFTEFVAWRKRVEKYFENNKDSS